MRPSLAKAILPAAIVALSLLFPGVASAATFGTDGCGGSEYKPETIVLACGDGKVVFEVREWTSWEEGEAIGAGVLRHPDLTAPGRCQETILACPWVESEGTAAFSRPILCSNGRAQFTRLRTDAPEDPDPELRQVRRSFRCSEYAAPRPPIRRLGSSEARRRMRTALKREPELAFRASYNRRVTCNRRVSRIRLRCTMSWIYGDVEYAGRGLVWLVTSGGRTDWAYTYTVRKRNVYCQATGGSNCVEVIKAP